MVSMRVVKTSISAAASAPAGASDPAGSTAKRTRAPSERPIQFRCIVSTFAGHSSSRSMPSSRPSAYSVMRRNHWSRSRGSTAYPQRQHPPSTTCSLASTVAQSGHQFTVDRRR